MSNLEYIKSYMVRLGVDLDQGSISKFNNFLKENDKKTRSWVKSLSSYALKVDGIFTTIIAGVAKYGSSIAKYDMELQRLSKHYYMTRDSAKAFRETLDAMDLTESDLQDISLNPELTRQYRELIGLAKSVSTPEAVKQTFKDIRNIGQEFNKLQLLFSYFQERLVHFIYRRIAGPSKNFRKFLQDFNQKFANNITRWASKVADIISIIVRLAIKWKEIISSIGSSIKSIWNTFSGFTKSIIAAIGLIALALKTNPIFASLSALLILIDDYQHYKKSLSDSTYRSSETLKPLWESFDKNKDKFINFTKPIIDWWNNEFLPWYKNFDLVKSLRSLWSEIKAWWEQSTLKKWLDKLLGESTKSSQSTTKSSPVPVLQGSNEYQKLKQKQKEFGADLVSGIFGEPQPKLTPSENRILNLYEKSKIEGDRTYKDNAPFPESWWSDGKGGKLQKNPWRPVDEKSHQSLRPVPYTPYPMTINQEFHIEGDNSTQIGEQVALITRNTLTSFT